MIGGHLCSLRNFIFLVDWQGFLCWLQCVSLCLCWFVDIFVGYFVMLFAGWNAFLSGSTWKMYLPHCFYPCIFHLFINVLAVQCVYSSYLLYKGLKQC
jgi:hypothetical protein